MTYSLGSASADRPQTGSVSMMRSGFETGFELNPIQRRAAVATPSQWRDFVVTAVATDGWIDLIDLDSADVDSTATARVWHYESTGVSVGEPVSVHGKYAVLAVGSALFSVRFEPVE